MRLFELTPVRRRGSITRTGVLLRSVGMVALSQREREAVEHLARRLRSRLADRLADVRLYGSRARGEGRSESDVDVAVVVTEHSPAVRREVFDEVSAVVLEHDLLLDVHVLDRAHLQALRRAGSPYARRLEEEGVPL